VIARHPLHGGRLGRCDEEHDDGSGSRTSDHDGPLAPDDFPVLASVHRTRCPTSRSRDVLTVLPLDLDQTGRLRSAAPGTSLPADAGRSDVPTVLAKDYDAMAIPAVAM